MLHKYTTEKIIRIRIILKYVAANGNLSENVENKIIFTLVSYATKLHCGNSSVSYLTRTRMSLFGRKTTLLKNMYKIKK